MKLILISDDLTGALDASVVFAARGLQTVVAISGDEFAAALNTGADVVAVSLNSREGSEADAVAKIAAAARLVQENVAVFKKIDSRMKGHVQAEVRALSSLIGARYVTLCPAIPSLGRYVEEGKVVGSGIAEPIDLAGSSVLVEEYPIWDFPDARTDADLNAIVNSASAGTLFCGARGLAEALARKLAPGGVIANFGGKLLPHPILFAIGSRDPITLAQVEAFREAAPKISYVIAPNGLLAPSLLPEGELILQTAPGEDAVASAMVTQVFARAVAARGAPGRACLVLSGGETAAATLSRLGIGILEIVGEPEEGMPASVPFGLNGPVIVTKSGGFGGKDALIRLAGL